MASVRSIDSALGITLTNNGRIMRNLIHGADTVMSHILHFYHLAAADFVDISALGAPWSPAFGTTTDAKLTSLLTVNTLNGGITKELVESYVMALQMRKEAHTMGAIFSGRHPIQNAIVPGGVATIFTQSDIDLFDSKLNTVRNFINSYYIPDVVFVATRTSPQDWTAYWGVGADPGGLLSYGDYPNSGVPFDSTYPDANDMLISRGTIASVSDTPTVVPFDTNAIAEYVDYSFYSNPGPKHPSEGVTTPLSGSALSAALTSGPQYSWLKAPRYNGAAMEVGPLARMLVTAFAPNTTTVTEAGSNNLHTYIPNLPNISAGYDAATLVTAAITAINTDFGTSLTVSNLWSPLGRHAARALECKYVADAMHGWLADLDLNNTVPADGAPYTTAVPAGAYTTSVATGSGYTYVAIPKATVSGEGLAEAPRGALGHWITIQSKKIASYQCVVPTTWNASPKANLAAPGDHGPAEAALIGTTVGTEENSAILNIARMLHPYDFCIACAVHVVTPEGKDIAKFKMDLDGKVKRLPLDSE